MKSERSRLMKKLIDYHSWFARKRDGRCVSCEMRGIYNPVKFNAKGYPISHNNGHFIGGRSKRMSLMFEITNQNCQCVPCNINHNSDRDDYTAYMLKTFGQEEIDRLESLKHKSVHFTIPDLKEMLKDIKQKYEALPDKW